MKGRLLLVALIALAVAAPATANPGDVPRLSPGQAELYAGKAVQKRYGYQRYSYADCTHRISFRTIRCKVFFGGIRKYYSGSVVISYKRPASADLVYWFYDFKHIKQHLGCACE